MSKRIWILGVIPFLLILKMTLFVVDEKNQAVVLQLGKPVRIVKEPGLHSKIPFLQKVVYFEDRILEYDAAPTEILSKDKKNLVVDNYARWRIIDPLKFMQTVRDENGAQLRLDDIIYSEIRIDLGLHTLVEIISTQREKIMQHVTERCNKKAKDFGIEVIDVRIKRADLPPENEEHVYARMRAERRKMAKMYRSQGEEEAMKIRANTDKEKMIILSEARRKAEIIRGDGDALAIKIYAKAFGKDPSFYSFLRTLEAYRKCLSKGTTAVLSSDSEFFKYLSK
jgi:membrane protease subunit HflC